MKRAGYLLSRIGWTGRQPAVASQELRRLMSRQLRHMALPCGGWRAIC